jgi:hypothetical protein
VKVTSWMQVDQEMVVTLSMVVTIESTLIFQGGRIGKGKGVVASFWLLLEKLGS